MTVDQPTALELRLRDRIRREGPISFADFMDAALGDPDHGFFSTGHGAGRAGADFVTSPEVGSLFGALVARHIDRVWDGLGRPDPFVVIEAGAGRGRLAADVLRSSPACAPALRYILVERSAALTAEQHQLLRVEPAEYALGPSELSSDPDDPIVPVVGVGPIVTALAGMPVLHGPMLVIANELLDNLPNELVERHADGWYEVRVGLDDADGLAEVLVHAAPALAAEADVVAAGVAVPVGARLPVPVAARDWVDQVAHLMSHGEVVVVDYCDTAESLARRGSDAFLRTYRNHARGGSVLRAVGLQDVTCDVALEYLVHHAAAAGLTVEPVVTQAEWLRGLGLDDLVVEGARVWAERAHLGDLEALKGRSRAGEAAALTDPAGLGAHQVVRLTRSR